MSGHRMLQEALRDEAFEAYLAGLLEQGRVGDRPFVDYGQLTLSRLPDFRLVAAVGRQAALADRSTNRSSQTSSPA
jgi:hypothetical protein